MKTILSEWKKEWDSQAIERMQSKDKVDLEYGKKMDLCEADPEFASLKAELLKLYLEKMRYVYALAFFQWRKSNSSEVSEQKDIKLVFDQRRETILTQFHKLETIKKAAEEKEEADQKASKTRTPRSPSIVAEEKSPAQAGAFITQPVDEIELDALDGITARLNMDMKHKVT